MVSVVAERKIQLIHGGGDLGLSRIVSEAAYTRGSQVLFIIISSMQERIPKILNHADAFIFLIGDLTFLSWVHLNIHQKLIGLLNANIFYDDLITFTLWFCLGLPYALAFASCKSLCKHALSFVHLSKS